MNRTVLVLDSIALNRKLLKKLLFAEGIQTCEASKPDDVLALLQKENLNISLILMSLQHLGVDPTDLLESIKLIKPSIKVLVVTADTRPKIIQEIYEAGADGYLPKPFKSNQLIREVIKCSTPTLDFRAACRMLASYEHLASPTIILDHEQRLIHANEAFFQLYKLERSSVRHRPFCCDILKFAQCSGPNCVSSEAQALGTQHQVKEVSIPSTKGALHLTASYVPLLGNKAKPVGHLVTLTERSPHLNENPPLQTLYDLERRKSLNLEEVMLHLGEVNEKLERLVEERSQALQESRNQIKDILDHIDLGILAFDREGIISSGLSQTSQLMFNQTHLEGKQITDVFHLKSEEERNDLKSWINMAYQVHERLPWKKITHLCPLETWDFFNKKLESRYVPMIKDGGLDKILMISRDVTKEVTLAQEAKDEKHRRLSESETLTIMMEAPEKSLGLFLNEMKSRHTTLTKISSRPWSEGSYTLALRCAHTIKGSASLLHLNELTHLAHKLESTLIRFKDPLLEGKAQNVFIETFNPLSSCCYRLMTWGEKLKLFSTENNEQKDLRISSHTLKAILVWVSHHPESKKDPFWVSHFDALHQLTTVPCQELFLRFQNIVQQLATTLDKKATLICQEGQDIRLHQAFWGKWIDPLNHLLRNALCHGVESPEERLRQQKSEVASLHLNFQLNDGLFSISVSDDGRGIETNSLFNQWKKLNPDVHDMSQQDKINLIFEAGLSNASEVDHISGRGVGMDIVKTMATSLGGNISVDTQLGSGTTFKISVPYHDPILAPEFT